MSRLRVGQPGRLPVLRALWIRPGRRWWRHPCAAPTWPAAPPPGPDTIGVEHVIEHALRHLAWLLADDPAIREALPPAWTIALASYHPEPFRALA